jgi:GTP-binding protein
LGERAHGVADKHFTGPCLRANPRCDVDRRADEAIRRLDRLAGVNANADTDRLAVSCLGVGDDRQTALDGAADRQEDNVEAVALCPNLGSVEPIDLGANEEQLDFPIIFTIAKAGTASRELGTPGTNLRPLFDVILSKLPGPKHVPDAPVQFQANNLAYDDYVGRIAIGRVHAGALLAGGQYMLCRTEGSQLPCKITRLYGWHGLKRVEIERADSGDIVAIAGIEEINIGDTVADKDAPTALKPIRVDEPTITMLFGANTSPWAGRSGNKVTSRQVRDRLFQEILRNVSIRVEETEAMDTFRVVGRGELQLAVLIETMRREGFELTVGRPRVVFRTDEATGQRLEPIEEVIIDVDEAYTGNVVQKLSERRAEMKEMRPSGIGRQRLVFHAPTRGLIGYQSELLSDTRGSAVMNRIFHSYAPYAGEIPTRHTGALLSNGDGEAIAYAIFNLQDRGPMFIEPGTRVYAGMIVGEHTRGNDLEVNVLKGKKLTNIRAAGKDENVLLTPPIRMSLEKALSYIGEDELVEVTPRSIRLRKAMLDPHARKRASRAKVAENAA